VRRLTILFLERLWEFTIVQSECVKWLLAGFGLIVLIAGTMATAEARPQPGQIPQDAMRLAGSWDITVNTPRGAAYSWIEAVPSGATLVGRFVGTVGSARPISRIEFSEGVMRFTAPRQYEAHDLAFEGKLEGNRLAGAVTGYDKSPCTWTATRAPSLKRAQRPRWSKAISLFNGINLEGWVTQGSDSHWIVQDGLLANARDGANLVSTGKFEDFKLHAEFRYPAGSNSGIYLRGRYEVQIEDDEGREVNVHTIGGIYGFFAPCLRMSKKPGEWQTFDITLVGRVATIVFNGETVVDRQTIPGITGGALDSDEGSPGPIMIQGDHGRIEFRKILIVPSD
jgi:hypothetical protein